MIDSLDLHLFFNDEALVQTADGVQNLVYELLSEHGMRVAAGDSEWMEIQSGEFGWVPSRFNCPWDSIPSSFSGLAVKAWDGNRLTDPYITLKASPAKILQGHNVFGPTDLRLCAMHMIESFAASFPSLAGYIAFDKTTIGHIDVTYSCCISDQRHQLAIIQFFKNISSGQMRRSVYSDDYETTAYFGSRTSKKLLRKAYLKGAELLNELHWLESQIAKIPDIEEAKKIPKYRDLIQRHEVLSNPELINFARKLLRLEARLKPDWLRRRDIPLKLVDLIQLQDRYHTENRCLISELWSAAFGDLLNALAGEGINMQDHEKVHDKLRSEYKRETKNGFSYAKADRIYRFYRELVNDGYESVYRTSARNTFGRNLKELIQATGLSKAQLQNLKPDSQANVVPFCQMVKIDFNSQRPDWYQEPVSDLTHIQQGIRHLRVANF